MPSGAHWRRLNFDGGLAPQKEEGDHRESDPRHGIPFEPRGRLGIVQELPPEEPAAEHLA
jgi:hypothetical protein